MYQLKINLKEKQPKGGGSFTLAFYSVDAHPGKGYWILLDTTTDRHPTFLALKVL